MVDPLTYHRSGVKKMPPCVGVCGQARRLGGLRLARSTSRPAGLSIRIPLTSLMYVRVLLCWPISCSRSTSKYLNGYVAINFKSPNLKSQFRYD